MGSPKRYLVCAEPGKFCRDVCLFPAQKHETYERPCRANGDRLVIVAHQPLGCHEDVGGGGGAVACEGGDTDSDQSLRPPRV